MAEKTKYIRLFDLYRRFMNHAHLTIGQMMNDYGINRRTANRDINDLNRLGVKLVHATLDDGQKVWSLENRSREIKVPFNLTDIAALFMGRGLFNFAEGTILDDSLEKIFQSIENQIVRNKDIIKLKNLKRKIHVISETPKHLNIDQIEDLDEIITGLFNENLIEFDYLPAKEKNKSHVKVAPYTLVSYKNGLYLLAENSTDKISHHKEKTTDQKIYAVERISDARAIKKTSYKLPNNFSPEEHFKNALFFINGTPQKVVLLFNKGSEPYLLSRKIHHSQKIEKYKNGKIKLTLHVPASENDFEIINWIISYHEHVKVLSPLSLKNAVKKKLKAAYLQYEN